MNEPGDKAAGLLHYAQRVRAGHLVVAAPGLACALLLCVWLPREPWARIGLVAAAVAVSLWLSRWSHHRLLSPLQTLSGLLEALREGDYSLRAAARSPLGDLVFHFNALADRLQRERLEFEESTHLLGKTLSSLDSAVFAFDEGNRLRLVNPAGLRLLAADRSRLFGRTATELGLGDWLAGAPSRVLAHAFPGTSGRFEVRRASLRTGGKGGCLLVVNDMSAALRDEERLAWQRLLRVLGHEVNNSLAPIRSVASTLGSLLERDPLPDDWRDDFRGGMEVIGHRAEALGRFLTSYGKLARLPSPTRVPVELTGLLRKLVLLERRVAIDLTVAGAVTVHADADQVEQALINLLQNAVDATPSPGGNVRVSLRTDATRVTIDIDDDGPGPPPSDNLFVPFFTTKPAGSGIGLALARQIAEAHDGGVSLCAREGEPRTAGVDGAAGVAGARASLWLPLPDHRSV